MDKHNALEMIFVRNTFYRRLYHLALATLIQMLIVIGLLSGMLFYLIMNPPKPIYFATDPMSRLIEVVPVDRPNMTLKEVSDWVVDAVQSTYSYNYINYRTELQNAQKYFTNYGWRNYMKALTASRNIVGLTNRQMIISASVIDTPKVIREGSLSGSYAYRMTMPLLVTYSLPPYDSKSKFSNALQIDVLVERMPILQSYKGLGVLQMIGTVTSGLYQPSLTTTTP
jgi:intracellular multiplication protein IcmL